MIYYYAKLKDNSKLLQFQTLEEAFELAYYELKINFDIQVIVDYDNQNIYSKDDSNYLKCDYYRFKNRLFDVYDSELFQYKQKLIKIDYEIK